MELSVQSAMLLLLLCSIVSIGTRRLGLPYSVGLVTAGIVTALLPFWPQVALTKELLFSLLLPPLVFEAALSLDWKHLRKDMAVVVTLATVGVLLSVAVTSAGMVYLGGMQWASAIIFAVLISATDPVSVIATFRDARAHGRLLMLVESESLFNDGTAAVLFAIAFQAGNGVQVNVAYMGLQFVGMVGGSILCGGLVAAGTLLLAGRTEDHLVEVTFTAVAAYGSFLLAEQFHLSGVLATLAAGMILGQLGSKGAITPRGREGVERFWEFAAFIANSLIFLLIGMREAHENLLAAWLPVAIAVGVTLIGRAAAVYPACLLFQGSGLRVASRHQHVLFWGGLRGGLGLALALALPESIPQRDLIVTVTFGVVAFSIYVQGLTLTPLLRRFGEIPKAEMS